MEKSTKHRIKALQTFNGLMNVEMTGLRSEQRQANDRLDQLEARKRALESEIQTAESQIRSALDPGKRLVLEEYQMLLTYLDQKQRLKVNHERQIGFAQERCGKIEAEMVDQGLKIRGVEHVLERRFNELRLKTEIEQQTHLDEAWLLRPGRSND